MSLKTKIVGFITRVVSKMMGSSVSQVENGAVVGGKVAEGMPEILREAAREGAVLLKNDNNMLPISKDRCISVFGRVQYNYFATGYGSGGDVRKPYVVSLIDGLENCEDLTVNRELAKIYKDWSDAHEIDHGYWANWPRSYPEMHLNLDIVKKAHEISKDALIVIGRSSGEDRENTLDRGSYYLTKDEENMIETISSVFENVCIILNIGSVIDLSWIEKYPQIKSILLVWQGGMESGNAIADLISGKYSPSGKLTDTFAKKYEDFPNANYFGAKKFNNYIEDIYVGYRYFETFNKDAVLFPFGYGLTYTKFKQELVNFAEDEKEYTLEIKVSNIGSYKAKDVIEVYLQKPIEPIDNPYRVLVGFSKTKELEKGESEIKTIKVLKKQFSCYDSLGITGFKSSYVIEKGDYIFSIGEDVKSAVDVKTITIKENKIVEKLTEVLAPKDEFSIMKNNDGKLSFEKVPLKTINLKKLILDNIPKDIPLTNDKGYKLKDVKENKVSMDEFVAQLSLDELEAISRGDNTMDSPLGASGNAGVLGGVIESLREKGIPPITTTDGPSGIRLYTSCSLIPIGTLLACTYNEDLVQKVHEKLSQEMVDRGSDVLLAPGMNIHRSPLCGRNFEYYSEDPFVTGKIAAAAVRGIQKEGVSACPKHFACNSQETKRTTNDSRVSERALREIYLKGFEICIKEANPNTIMTSYNKINGVWNHYNYELAKTILRDEWKWDGLVMTDWWMQYTSSPEFPFIKDQGYRVRSRVNVFMPGSKRMGKRGSDGTLLASYGKENGITLGEMQQNAKDVLQFLIKTNKV